MAQEVKNIPAVQEMQETWVQSLGCKDPLEEGKATHSSFLAWRIPMDRIVHGVAKSWTRLSDFHLCQILCVISCNPLKNTIRYVLSY